MLKKYLRAVANFWWWKHPYAESPRNTVMKERLVDVLAVVALYYTPTRSR
jgi:hypothetical protein